MTNSAAAAAAAAASPEATAETYNFFDKKDSGPFGDGREQARNQGTILHAIAWSDVLFELCNYVSSHNLLRRIQGDFVAVADITDGRIIDSIRDVVGKTVFCTVGLGYGRTEQDRIASHAWSEYMSSYSNRAYGGLAGNLGYKRSSDETLVAMEDTGAIMDERLFGLSAFAEYLVNAEDPSLDREGENYKFLLGAILRMITALTRMRSEAATYDNKHVRQKLLDEDKGPHGIKRMVRLVAVPGTNTYTKIRGLVQH